MTVQEFYDCIGSDYDEVLSRMLNDTLIQKYLKKFPADPHYAMLLQSVQEGDQKTAYLAAHTLKGLCLSLGFDAMSISVVKLTDELRAGKAPLTEACLAQISPLYTRIVELIAKL